MTELPQPRRRRRGKLIVAVCVAALVQIALFVAVITVILHARQGDAPEPVEDWATQADDVVAAVESISDDPAAIVAGQAQADLEADPASVIDPATAFDAVRETWVPDGIGGGVIQVTVTQGDGTATDYLAVMVKEGDEWKVLSTIGIR
jgi:hypothetical protein